MRARRVALWILAAVAGCATKDTRRQENEAAFQAGQQQALQQLYEAKFPVVTVLGPVRHSKLDWTEGMTLARAIVGAQYVGLSDPREVILRRGDQQFHVAPKQLLAGEDWLVQPGDCIEIVP